MKLITILSFFGIIFLAILIGSCDKTKPYELITPAPAVHFVGDQTQSYTLDVSTVGPDTIMIGTTDVSTTDRTVTYNVTSPSGAVAGSQYTISPAGTVTIPAGKSTANIVIQGNYSSYTAGRKDTLIFSLSEPSIKVAAFLDTVQLILRGPCFEGDVDLNTLLGSYNKTNEDFGGQKYGPYKTSIISINPISATSGQIKVSNIFDAGWNPITFLLDWTDPNNRTVTLTEQSGIGDAGTLSASYAGMDISVKPYTGEVGTFSACNEKITLVMQVGVTGLGYFSDLYVVTLAR